MIPQTWKKWFTRIAPVLLIALVAGCNITIPPLPDIPTNNVPPIIVVTNVPPLPDPVVTNVPPIPATGAWRYTLFTDANAYENSHGASSQMSYFSLHNKPNENLARIEMLKAVQKLGGNVNCYIRGNWGGGDVLSMALDGRAHPQDGHYFPIKAPTADAGEVDWAMWAAQSLGITKQLCWVWNDDNSMPITRDTVAKAVASHTGSRLGAENIGYGVCLESSEIMSPAQGAQCLKWIKELAPQSRAYIGSSPTDFLIAVKNAGAPADAFYWLEVDTSSSGNPITEPINAGNVQARAIAKADRLAAAGIPKAQIVIGEIWSLPADRKEVTRIITAAGYACSGSWNQ